MLARNMLANFDSMFFRQYFFIILKLTHFKPVFFLQNKGSWSLLAKTDTSLLRMSIFCSCFFHTFC